MNIKGTTRTLGLIGNPVEHTMSPTIHNTLAQDLGHDLVYVPFHVETGRIADAVKGAFALNLKGLNVTVPYKSDVIESLVDIDDLAKNIGAVNTLVRKENGFKGYNTDMPGLYRAMQSDGVELSGQDVLILGAGGVARAVVFLCATKNVKSITILNRTVERAEQVAAEVSEKTGYKNIRVFANEDAEKALDRKYLAIQCTNIGMHPKTDEVVFEQDSVYQSIHTGYDLIFNPAETKFMKLVKAHGGQAFNGLKMLLFQGIIAYELWNETSIPESEAMRVYDELKKGMGIK